MVSQRYGHPSARQSETSDHYCADKFSWTLEFSVADRDEPVEERFNGHGICVGGVGYLWEIAEVNVIASGSRQ